MALPRIGAVAPLVLAALALGLLALGPFGLRLYRLMPASGLLAAIALVLAILALAREWSRLRPGGRAMLFVALALAASLVYVPVFYWQTRKTVPPIHDITTDLDNPPAFSAVLPARAAERAGSLDRRTPQLGELQKAAYPDLAPLATTLPPTRAFAEALEVAKSMPGWTIVAARQCRPHRGERANPLVPLHRRCRHQGRRRRSGKPHRRALHQPAGPQ